MTWAQMSLDKLLERMDKQARCSLVVAPYEMATCWDFFCPSLNGFADFEIGEKTIPFFADKSLQV